MIGWQYKAIFALGLALALYAGYNAWHSHVWNQGYNQAQLEYKAAVAAANAQIQVKKRTIKHETQNLDRNGLIRDLCANGWVRDMENCPK